MDRIPVYSPSLDGNEAAYVADCLHSGWISSRGPFIERFEKAFADYTGAENATSVVNGTAAIHVALEALGIGPGDEVIVPSFTYIASVNTILQTGATPIYVDSLDSTLQLDPEAVRCAITPRTKAVMAVHLYGHPCDMDALTEISRDNGLLLVEDCAEAFGTRWNGRHVGTFGDAATFSFFGNKTITTGEGGMVLTRNPDVLARCRRLKNQGMSPTRRYWHDELGYNYRMTNIEAAIGLAQIERADRFIAAKAALAASYRVQLAGLPLRTHDPVGNVVHSHWMCSIILDRAEDRDPLSRHLEAAGVETRPFFPQVHRMPHTQADVDLPVGDKLSRSGINLPSYPALTAAQIDYISASVRAFWQ